MLLTNWPMQFRGTIKGISPEQAKKMFNYDMPPDAKGVSFSIKNNKTEIRPYFPEKYYNHTPMCPLLKTNAKAFSTLGTIAKQITKTIIRPSWTLIADEEEYMSGYHMFISVNLKLIPSGLENILLTIGNLPPPEIHNDILKKDNTLEIKTKNSLPGYQLGALTINPQTLQITHHFNKTIPIPTPDSLVFIYYKQNKNFSPSICISPSSVKGIKC